MVSVTVPDRCLHPQVSSTHPLLLKNASSKNRRMEDLNTKDFILRKSQLSLHVLISSILQAEERQGANPGKDSLHLGMFSQSSWLGVQPHWQQLFHFPASAEHFQGGKQNHQFNKLSRKHLHLQWRKTEWLVWFWFLKMTPFQISPSHRLRGHFLQASCSLQFYCSQSHQCVPINTHNNIAHKICILLL